MDHANQPAGQPPPDSSSTQPFRITPGWPAEYELAPGYGPPPGSAAPPVFGPSPPSPRTPGGGPEPQPPDDPEPRPRRGRHRTLLRWTGGIAAAVLLAAGGTLAGLKLTGSSAPSNTPVAVALNNALGSPALAGPAAGCQQAAAGGQAPAGQCRREHPLRRVRGMYGQVTYHGRAGTATLAFERGTVGLASNGQLVVRAPDGTTWTWALAGNAVVRDHGMTVSPGAVSSGTRVFIAGRVAGGSKDAQLVLIKPANSSSPGSSPGAAVSSPLAPG
jgi:hypothetical protein